MPAFPFCISTASFGFIKFKANEGRGNAVSDLTNQQQVSRHAVTELQHIMQKDEQVCEPHGSTEVVEDMAHAIRKSLRES